MKIETMVQPTSHITRKHITIFVLVYACYLLSFFSRLLINPIIPTISVDLRLTKAQMGGFMSAFYLGYVLTNLPGGLLTDKLCYRKVILGTLLALGVSTLLFGTVTSFMIRVLAGIGSGATFSACLRAIFEWFPKNKGMATGILQTGTTGGLLMVNLAAPPFTEQHGWQYTFFIMGLIPLVFFALSFFYLPNPMQTDKPKASSVSSTFWRDVLSMFKNRNLVLLGLSGFFAMAATWGTASWANTYLNGQLNLSLVTAGSWMSPHAIASVIAKTLTGSLMDKFQRKNKKYYLSALLLVLVPALMWFSRNNSVSALYVLIPLLGITAFAYSPVMNTFIGELVPVEKTGAAVGFLNTIWQLGSLSAPIGMGMILDTFGNSYYYAFSVLAVCAFISGMIVLFISLPHTEK
ncbi:MFS transporter [Candidatus Symbiopectobacterium sp. 'North America']|uniref:MFS transporter n=1 Tax=Candidatus Symbiopectobacterium sp. 'North America' TaxID=2794574 RepID=UPI0018CB59C5|nr:MFS transporter [Candidatus Symbiopectobacterium sp. 'North America']MBG6244561.1 MFS transporter [Candidatus Symbiopectobacterium sp. 'North America']